LLVTVRGGGALVEHAVPPVPVQLDTNGSSAKDCSVFTPVTGYRATTVGEVPEMYVHCNPSGVVAPTPSLKLGWGPGPEVPASLTVAVPPTELVSPEEFAVYVKA